MRSQIASLDGTYRPPASSTASRQRRPT
jgi:hypothetical protein